MKNVSTIFLGIVSLTALGVYVFDLVTGRAIPDVVNMVVTASVSVALTAAGFNHGQTVANGVANEAAANTVQAFVSAQNTTPMQKVDLTNAGQDKGI